MENKQTNKHENVLASHFKSGVFDMERWDAAIKRGLPNFIKKIHHQVEICPLTHRRHYQVHVELSRQQRPSAINSWWGSYTKWIAVKGKEHIANSIGYTSKKDGTQVDGTHRVHENEEEYLRLHDLLLQIAEEFEPNIIELETADDPAKALRLMKEYDEQFLFKNASKWIVKKDVKWISKLSQPFLEKAWNYYHDILLDEVKKEREGGGGPHIIEGTSIVDAVPPPSQSASERMKNSLKLSYNATLSKADRAPQANEDVTQSVPREDDSQEGDEDSEKSSK
jgi:hypothetical protein